ncbi:heavy metal-associated domain-containing protein [Mycoplasmatota bacterium WC30]
MKFLVDNMSCIHCENKIKAALKAAGFKKIKINLDSKEVVIALGKKDKLEVEKVVTSIGYNFKEI